MKYELRDTVDTLVDLLDCTRDQATSIIVKARREGYPLGRATEVQGDGAADGDSVTTDRGTITVSDPTGPTEEEVRD